MALTSRSDVNAKTFRASHEEHLSALDELERGLYLERRDDTYRPKLFSLIELKDADQKIDTVLNLCERVFSYLRAAYKKNTDAPIRLVQMVHDTGISEFELRPVLMYLTDAPIWGGYTSDLLRSQEVTVFPGESILRYKTFYDVMQQLRGWSDQATGRASVRLQPSIPAFLSETKVSLSTEAESIPEWYSNLPTNIRDMLLEVRYGLRKEMLAAFYGVAFRR